MGTRELHIICPQPQAYAQVCPSPKESHENTRIQPSPKLGKEGAWQEQPPALDKQQDLAIAQPLLPLLTPRNTQNDHKRW